MREQARVARIIGKHQSPEYTRTYDQGSSDEEYGHPVGSHERPYVRPRIVRVEGEYPRDYDASPHPIFRRVQPALEKAFPNRGDGDSEGNLVGSMKENEDWATNLQHEEHSIQKEDQKVDDAHSVEKVDKTPNKDEAEEKNEEKPAEEKPAEEKPAEEKKEEKPKFGEQDVSKVEKMVKGIGEQMNNLHKEINPKIVPAAEDIAVKAVKVPEQKVDVKTETPKTPAN